VQNKTNSGHVNSDGWTSCELVRWEMTGETDPSENDKELPGCSLATHAPPGALPDKKTTACFRRCSLRARY